MNKTEDYLIIGKEKYPIDKYEIDQSKLMFYPEILGYIQY